VSCQVTLLNLRVIVDDGYFCHERGGAGVMSPVTQQTRSLLHGTTRRRPELWRFQGERRDRQCRNSEISLETMEAFLDLFKKK